MSTERHREPTSTCSARQGEHAPDDPSARARVDQRRRTTGRPLAGVVIAVGLSAFAATGCAATTDDLSEDDANTTESAIGKKPESCVMIDDGYRPVQQCYTQAYDITVDDILRVGMTAGTCANVVITMSAAAVGTTTIVLTPAAALSAAVAVAELGYCAMGIKESLKTLGKLSQCYSLSRAVRVDVASTCNVRCPSHSSRVVDGSCYCATEPGACTDPVIANATPSPPSPPPSGCTQTATTGGCATCSIDKSIDPQGRANCTGSEPAPVGRVLWNMRGAERFKCTAAGWRKCLN